MNCILHKISISNKEVKFVSTKNEFEYEVYFENCVSTINFNKLFNGHNDQMKAETLWASTGERVYDTISLESTQESPIYPESDGYKIYAVTWASSTAVDRGYFILKCS